MNYKLSSFQHLHSLHCASISNSKKKLVVSKELTEERHSVALMLHGRNIYPHVTTSLETVIRGLPSWRTWWPCKPRTTLLRPCARTARRLVGCNTEPFRGNFWDEVVGWVGTMSPQKPMKNEGFGHQKKKVFFCHKELWVVGGHFLGWDIDE